MSHKLRSVFSLFLIPGIVSGQSFLLGGCSAFSPSSVASGTSCPITYGATEQHACPAHNCAMHNPATVQHDQSQCPCDHQADTKDVNLTAARP